MLQIVGWYMKTGIASGMLLDADAYETIIEAIDIW